MRTKRFLGIGAMAMFVVSACSTAASPAPSSPAASTAAQSQAPASAPAEAKTLTVWLMNGSASDDLVKQLNTEFGALMDLTDKRADLGGGTSADSTSADEAWLGGLNDSSIWQDKLYAVPLLAGDRIVIYNKDQFTAAGIDPASITSKEKVIAAAKTLQDKNKGVADYSGARVL